MEIINFEVFESKHRSWNAVATIMLKSQKILPANIISTLSQNYSFLEKIITSQIFFDDKPLKTEVFDEILNYHPVHYHPVQMELFVKPFPIVRLSRLGKPNGGVWYMFDKTELEKSLSKLILYDKFKI